MKVLVVLVALLSYSVSILDRSYYDALCTLQPTQNCLSAPARKTSDSPSASCPKSTTPIATRPPASALRKSTLVATTLCSLLDSL